jgi:hypothetical protein
MANNFLEKVRQLARPSGTQIHRPSLLQLLWAFVAGCVLAWLLAVNTNFIAVLSHPTPNWLQPLRQMGGWTGSVLNTVLIVLLPQGLFAGLFAWVAFGVLRASGLRMVLANSAPWFIYGAVADLSWYKGSNFSTGERLI